MDNIHEIHKCPFCGSYGCYKGFDSASNAIFYECSHFAGGCEHRLKAKLGSSIEDCPDTKKKIKLYNLVYEHCLKHTGNGDESIWWYGCSENPIEGNDISKHRIYFSERQYPQMLTEKVDRILVSLSIIYPEYAMEIYPQNVSKRLLFLESEDSENVGTFQMLSEMGYMTLTGNHTYYISADGWKRIDSIRSKQRNEKKGFIAMEFGEETNSIREAFRRGISSAGYAISIIDEKEHNNQIVPEIFYEIDSSSFLVMDVTYSNYGAYYEAGYALGKGKQVIICCRKKEFESAEKENRPHFDIAQKSMIIWEREDELAEKLKKRIECTVISN